ncbi:MAG: protein kinase [Chloroflexi bacterium]|nr:protein kinase [Chloroflexota bacterium]
MALSSPLFCDYCGAANRSQAIYCSACGQTLHASRSTTNTQTGLLAHKHMLKQRYVILAQVGRGGFGAVYKAADSQFGNRLVAIKEMSQSKLSAQELLQVTEAFKHEALLLASLTHPNLARVYEQFTDAGRSYLVMDFIEGETLESHLDKLGSKLLPLQEVLDIGLQLCSVLDYLHTRQPPIIFRDLKPANIMLTPKGHIYLIDFGIARHFKPGQSKDTTALGSSGYAAPEQYGKTQTTALADIYALGATLHQLLTGDNPADSPFHFAPLDASSQPILTELNTLLQAMLSVEIGKRPASAANVKQELLRIATQHTVALTHSLQYGTSAYKAQARASRAAKGTRSTPTPQLQPQSNTVYICYGHSGRVTGLGWSPDGKRLASTSYDKTVHMWDATNGNTLHTYKGHVAHVNALAWSPDSKSVATASDDGTVHIWDATTGIFKMSYAGRSGSVETLAWSPNGRHIASAGKDKTVHVWDATTCTQLSMYREHAHPLRALAWSPDGKRLASGGEGMTVHIWDAHRGQQKYPFFSIFFSSSRGRLRLSGHNGRINSLAWSPDGRHLAAASSTGQLLIWNMLTTALTFSKATSTAMKNVVVWSPSGKQLAVSSNDKTVQIWHVANKSMTHVYRGHLGYVTALAWSPDGTRIASGGVDRTIQVWRVV